MLVHFFELFDCLPGVIVYNSYNNTICSYVADPQLLFVAGVTNCRTQGMHGFFVM